MNAGKPLVSIVIPTYRRPSALADAIGSIQAQTWPDWEAIVVDDNDPAGGHRRETERFMARYREEPRIRYLRHDRNRGAPQARNTGLRAARGEYVAFLDDDDRCLPTKLEEQVRCFRTTPLRDVAIVYCRARYVGSGGKVLRYSVVEERGEALRRHLSRNIATTTTMLFRRDVVEAVGGFRDLICGQEYDLILRILLRGYRVDYVDRVLAVIGLHDSHRISTGAGKIQGIRELYRLKQPHLHLLDPRGRREVRHTYFLSMYREHLAAHRRAEALPWLGRAVRADPFNIFNCVEILSLLLGGRGSVALKRRLHLLKNAVRGRR